MGCQGFWAPPISLYVYIPHVWHKRTCAPGSAAPPALCGSALCTTGYPSQLHLRSLPFIRWLYYFLAHRTWESNVRILECCCSRCDRDRSLLEWNYIEPIFNLKKLRSLGKSNNKRTTTQAQNYREFVANSKVNFRQSYTNYPFSNAPFPQFLGFWPVSVASWFRNGNAWHCTPAQDLLSRNDCLLNSPK